MKKDGEICWENACHTIMEIFPCIPMLFVTAIDKESAHGKENSNAHISSYTPNIWYAIENEIMRCDDTEAKKIPHQGHILIFLHFSVVEISCKLLSEFSNDFF